MRHNYIAAEPPISRRQLLIMHNGPPATAAGHAPLRWLTVGGGRGLLQQDTGGGVSKHGSSSHQEHEEIMKRMEMFPHVIRNKKHVVCLQNLFFLNLNSNQMTAESGNHFTLFLSDLHIYNLSY